MEEIQKYQIRHQNKIDTTLNWETNNPILLSGEIGVEIVEISDKKELKMKIGHDNLNWNDLEYIIDDDFCNELFEKFRYYGDINIVPTDESYFKYKAIEDEGCRITGLTDKGKTLENIVIPYEISGLLVTQIGNFAFNRCKGLTSVNIPNSVTTIGIGAFQGCTNLTSVNIPNSVTTIRSAAFDGCKNLTSVNIPNSVTTIREYTFQNCASLTSVTIPNSVTTIENRAFQGCTNLTSVICRQGSYAETYAKKNGIKYLYADIAEEDAFITRTSHDESGNISIDKTYDEIKMAIENNKVLIAIDTDNDASFTIPWCSINSNDTITIMLYIGIAYAEYVISSDNTISEHFANLTTETKFMEEVGNINSLTTEAGDVVGAINEVKENMVDKITISSHSETDPVISLINNDEKRFGELASLTINWFNVRPKTYYQYTDTDGNVINAESTEGLNEVEYTEVYCYTSPDGTDVQYIATSAIIPTDSEGNEYILTQENVPLSELNLEDDFITSIIFTSGSAATNLIYPEEILFAGDGEDCIDNVFTPIPNKRYNVFISYDGQYLIGEVGGVSI